jgi:hypothetical protein
LVAFLTKNEAYFCTLFLLLAFERQHRHRRIESTASSSRGTDLALSPRSHKTLTSNRPFQIDASIDGASELKATAIVEMWSQKFCDEPALVQFDGDHAKQRQ